MKQFVIVEVAGANNEVLDVLPDYLFARDDNQAYVYAQRILTHEYDMGEPIWGTQVDDPTLAFAIPRQDRTIVAEFEVLNKEEMR